MTRLLLLAALLAGCTAAQPPAPLPPPPAAVAPPELQSCPGPVRTPVPPKGVKSPESIGRYATQLDEALVKAERARAQCSHRLGKLNDLVREAP